MQSLHDANKALLDHEDESNVPPKRRILTDYTALFCASVVVKCFVQAFY
jgi:hypothetical protein